MIPIRPMGEASPPPLPPRRTRRWVVLLTVVGLAAVAAGAYGWWWFDAVTTFRDRTIAWIEAQRKDGYRLDYADVSRRGFPQSLTLRFDGARLGLPSADWSWSADPLVVSMPLLHRHDVTVTATGRQLLTVGHGPHAEEFAGHADTASFTPTPGGWLPTGRLTIAGLSMVSTSGTDDIGAQRFEAEADGDPTAIGGDLDQPTYRIEASGEGVRLPAALATTFGREIGKLAITANLGGRLHREPWPAALDQWRAAGGVIEIPHILLAQGPLTLEGDGTLALDKNGQPICAMTARVNGLDATIDMLATDRILAPHEAAAAKILLGALARAKGDPAGTLTAPIALQDRVLSVGPVTLARLPQVNWLGSPPAR